MRPSPPRLAGTSRSAADWGRDDGRGRSRHRLHAGPGGALLVGGQPLRVLRLNPAAARVVARWRDGGAAPVGPAETALAARLHSYGLAVLRPDRSPYPAADVTVRRPGPGPARLPRPLPGRHRRRAGRVVVVDDGSRIRRRWRRSPPGTGPS